MAHYGAPRATFYCRLLLSVEVVTANGCYFFLGVFFTQLL